MDTKVAEFAHKLGARIVQLRKEHNYAQERLATLARMNKGYLSSVESGQRVPSVGMLAKLAKVLQVQIFDLFVFPENGPLERLWEEIRKGGNPAVDQLRAQYGLASGGKGRVVPIRESKARTFKAAAVQKKAARTQVRSRTGAGKGRAAAKRKSR